MPEEVHGARFESRFVLVGGRRMHARMSLAPVPVGSPVVLVHGLIVASSYLMPAAAKLAERFRVYVPELPGFGQSERPRRSLDVDGQARALLGWLDAMDIERASFLANSNGCQTVAALAERWPWRVDRVVLTSPTIDAEARSVRKQMGRWLANVTREPPSLLPVLLRDFRDAGMWQLVVATRAMWKDRIEARLPRVPAPALVVRGGTDPVVPQRWAERVASLLPRGELVVIPGAPHTLNWDVPETLYQVAAPFLAGRELPGTLELRAPGIGLSP